MLRVLRTVAAVVAVLLLGVVVGILGAFHHPSVLTVAGTDLPAGVVVGILALLLAEVVARDAVPYGVGPAVVLVGWVVTVGILGTSRPEGDLVVPGTTAGEAFLYGGFLAGIALATTLAVRGASGAWRDRR